MIQLEARRAGTDQPPTRAHVTSPTLRADRVLIRIPRLDAGPAVWLIAPLRRAIEQGAAAARRLAARAQLAGGQGARRHVGWKRPAAWGTLATVVLVCVAVGAYRGRSTKHEVLSAAPPFGGLPQPGIEALGEPLEYPAAPPLADERSHAGQSNAATDAPAWSSAPRAAHAGHGSFDDGPRAAVNEPARAGYAGSAAAVAEPTYREYPSTAQPHGEYPLASGYAGTDYRGTTGPSGEEFPAAYPMTSHSGHGLPATSSEEASAAANYPASIPLVASLPVPRRPRPERRDSHADRGAAAMSAMSTGTAATGVAATGTAATGPSGTGSAREYASPDDWSPAAAPEYRTAVAPAAAASGEANAPAALAPPAAYIDRGIVIERQQETSR